MEALAGSRLAALLQIYLLALLQGVERYWGMGAAADYSPDEDEKGKSYGDFLSFSPTGVSSNKRRLLIGESLGLGPGTIILLVISSKESRLHESWRRFVGLQISADYALSFVRDKVTHIQIVVHVDHNAEGSGIIQGATERSDAIRQIETGSAGLVLSLKGSTARSQQLPSQSTTGPGTGPGRARPGCFHDRTRATRAGPGASYS